MLDSKKKRAVKLRWEGYKTHEIASMLSIHRATLWRWWQRDDVQKCALRYWQKESARILESGQNKRLNLLDSSDPLKTQNAALEVIDHCIGLGIL